MSDYDDRQDDIGGELADREARRMQRAAVTAGVRVDSINPGHVQVSVFVGRNEGARGHSGHLTFRTDEFNELVERGLTQAAVAGFPGRLVIVFDVMEPM